MGINDKSRNLSSKKGIHFHCAWVTNTLRIKKIPRTYVLGYIIEITPLRQIILLKAHFKRFAISAQKESREEFDVVFLPDSTYKKCFTPHKTNLIFPMLWVVQWLLLPTCCYRLFPSVKAAVLQDLIPVTHINQYWPALTKHLIK